MVNCILQTNVKELNTTCVTHNCRYHQCTKLTHSNNSASMVNVFLGTSGDHGQLSPAASYPFSMMSIDPQTYPKLHAGYEYEAKRFLVLRITDFEGVGCQGSGGNILYNSSC